MGEAHRVTVRIVAGIGKRRCAEALQTLSPGSPLPILVSTYQRNIAGIGKRRCTEALQTLSPGSPLPILAFGSVVAAAAACYCLLLLLLLLVWQLP